MNQRKSTQAVNGTASRQSTMPPKRRRPGPVEASKAISRAKPPRAEPQTNPDTAPKTSTKQSSARIEEPQAGDKGEKSPSDSRRRKPLRTEEDVCKIEIL